ncbi:MAG: hypothetical protein ACSHXY_01155 [Alphaproteobacteria bacterium]
MRKFITSGLGLAFIVSPVAPVATVFANVPEVAEVAGEAPLLNLCDNLGETKAECKCYVDEVKKVYEPADVALVGGAVKRFLGGEEPDTILFSMVMTRQLSFGQLNQMYRLGDKHSDRIGKLCEDREQVMTPEALAKREAMNDRITAVVERYGIGQ